MNVDKLNEYLQAMLGDKSKNLIGYEDSRLIARDANIFLNANEAGRPPSWLMDSEQSSQLNFEQHPNRYSNPTSPTLQKAYADYMEIDNPESILLCRGSDEAIDLIIRSACNPGDKVIYCPPTYDMYRVSIETNGVVEKLVDLTEDYQLDVPAVKDAILTTENAKLLIICNPNSPTSNLLNREDIRELIKFTKDKMICLVDEAYIDFSRNESVKDELADNPHLVICRTMSKAFGLAGLRLGYSISNPLLRQVFRKMQAPYPIAGNLISIAEKALSQEGLEYLQNYIDEVKQIQTNVVTEFERLPFIKKVFRSSTNFIFIIVDNSEKLFKYLIANKILIRDMSHSIPNSLRISVGLEQEMQELIRVFKSYNS